MAFSLPLKMIANICVEFIKRTMGHQVIWIWRTFNQLHLDASFASEGVLSMYLMFMVNFVNKYPKIEDPFAI